MVNDVVITSAVRTAIGSFGGTIKNFSAIELGKIVVKEALLRSNIKPDQVDEVIMGNVLQAGLGQNPARQISVQSGIHEDIPAFTVNKVCGSGLKSIVLGAQSIKCNDAEIIVAGGTESMSNSPFLINNARWGYRMGNGELIDEMIRDGLSCALNNFIHMGITAENIAKKYNITREEQDLFAEYSQQKAEAAIKAGYFKDEIIPIEVPVKKSNPIIFDTDEFPKFGTTVEKLSKLKPAFIPDGTVTAGNSSGINDGAGAVVLMSKTKADNLGIKPLAKIINYAYVGVESRLMGLGPVGAIKKVLQKSGLSLDEIDLIELNEAFAAQSLGVLREINIDKDKLNTSGGAIALGHPIGASGTRILVTLLYGMIRRDSKLGLAALCIGGGMGIAMIIEKI